MVNSRLPHGWTTNPGAPPLVRGGQAETIRRFFKRSLTKEDLLAKGSLTPELLQFLEACVEARLNILIVGGSTTGKTTLLNVLCGLIPTDERIVTIEDAPELQLHHQHLARLVTRTADVEGGGAIAIRDQVIDALAMQPDRIIVGECRGSEAFDLLNAVSTARSSLLMTLHAKSVNDAIARLRVMCQLSGTDLPSEAIEELVGSALHLIVLMERDEEGRRRIACVSEIGGVEHGQVRIQHLFQFVQSGMVDGRIEGRLEPCGTRPSCAPVLERIGAALPDEIYGIRSGWPTDQPG